MPSRPSLTDTAVRGLAVPTEGQVDTYDQQYPGLSVRVSHKGRRTWNYSFRIQGKQVRLKLGNYPGISVKQAHQLWREKQALLEAGKNPAGDDAGDANDFESVFRDWLKKDQANNRSLKAVRGSIELHVLPYWQGKGISEISKKDCLAVLDRIVDTGHIAMANRVHERLRRMFRWCISRDTLQMSPMATVLKPGDAVRRDRVLTDVELTRVWKAARQAGGPYGHVYQLLILTGARREEIGQLRWSEIRDNAIHLSGDRTKNGEPHIIPLSSAARAVLDSVLRIEGSDYVFTFSGAAPVSGWSRAKLEIDELSGVSGWRVHDLRRTCATGLQKLGTPLQVTEAILGHTAGSRGGIVGLYQRHDYASEKKAALEAWGAHVMALVEGGVRGKVLPMRAGA